MKKSFKPEGYNSLSPYFVIEGAESFVDFLKTLFRAEVTRRYDMPDGSIMHLELRIDDSILMIGEASDQFPATTHLMHLYTHDVDTLYARALELGCEPIAPPGRKEGEPDRRGTFKDDFGNIWSVATQLD
jgi:PhnB protein